MWPMFLFGFAGIFIITQMHGLGLKGWVKWLLFTIYILGALAVYTQPLWQGKLWQLIAIPAIDYLAVVVLALLIAAGMWIYRRIKGKPADTTSISAASA